MLAGLFDRVVVVAGAADDAGVAAVTANVERVGSGDVGLDAGEDLLAVVKGKKGEPSMVTVHWRIELHCLEPGRSS